MSRIVPPTAICAEMWEQSVLKIGLKLSEAYLQRLKDVGLFELSLEAASVKGKIGGASASEADQHFAARFVNSAGRCVCAALDPTESLDDVSDLVLRNILDGHTVILDAPCGAGAAGTALLSILRALRTSNALPTLPLRLTIVAGDVSNRAIEHYYSVFSAMRDALTEAGVHVDLITQHWDATDLASSSQLIDRVVEALAPADRLMAVTLNFSGAMTDKNLRERLEHFNTQLLGRTASWPASLLWLEPKSKSALADHMPYVKKLFQRIASWFKNSQAHTSELRASSYKLYDPVSETSFDSSVAVIECEIGGLPWTSGNAT